MTNKMTNGMKMMKRALALCLGLVLLAGAACAENNMMVLSSGAEDWLKYECTLPDGRILLTGGKMENGKDGNFVPWIVCLNADRTTSWELIDRQQDGSVSAGRAAVLEDGTIAINVGEHTESEVIKFYTKDGDKAREDLVLSPTAIVEAAEANYLMLTGVEDGNESTVVIDYEGKTLFRYDGVCLPNGYGFKVKGEADPVVYGTNAATDGSAKIMKLNGMENKAVWETVLDFQMEDTDTATLCEAVKTNDGGYAAWLRESCFTQGENGYEDVDILVKFDAEGKLQWTSSDSFKKNSQYIGKIFAYNGKIAVLCVSKGDNAYDDMNKPQIIRWFGDEGTERGTTELKLNPEELTVMKEYLTPKDPGTTRTPSVYDVQLIPMEDGMWALVSCGVWENEGEENVDTIFESHELVMVKVEEK